MIFVAIKIVHIPQNLLNIIDFFNMIRAEAHTDERHPNYIYIYIYTHVCTHILGHTGGVRSFSELSGG